jgi:hypothetical protein
MVRKITMFLMVFALGAFGAVALTAQEKPQPQAPKPAGDQVQEITYQWNGIGQKLIAMAEDWPEDKYDFRTNPDVRTFAEQLLHAAGTAALLTHAAKGEAVNYDDENPSRKVYKTKADVVAFVKKAFADGAATIKEQGEAGLQGTVKYPYGNQMVHRSLIWTDTIEHSGEHYGQLVQYYRVNGVVPPASRPRK